MIYIVIVLSLSMKNYLYGERYQAAAGEEV